MKRSELNHILRESGAFLKSHQFALPPFASWTPDEWKHKGEDVREIVERRLGWDVTDFALGDFARTGLALFTLRNGAPTALETGKGKLYAEKILIVGVNQVTPLHFHWRKMEDIINRGGGNLLIELYNSTESEGLANDDVTASIDGSRCRVKAGGIITLQTGESITLVPGLYHRFWGEGSAVLVGEVSSVNDDNTDNRFYEPLGRFPSIQEDEPPLHLLVSDYDRYYSAKT